MDSGAAIIVRVKELLTRHEGEPLSLREIREKLDVAADDRKALRQALAHAVEEGELLRAPGRRFLLPHRAPLVEGVVHRHGKGYGWLIDTGLPGESDPFIPPEQMEGLLHGERVRARLENTRTGRPRAIIEEVLDEHPRTLGTLTRSARHAYVQVDGIEDGFLVVEEAEPGIPGGMVVEVELVERSERMRRGLVRLLRSVGKAGALNVEVDKLVALARVPVDFPPETLAEIAAFDADIVRQANGDGLRADVTDLPLVTIDGETAKDFDDAVCVAALDSGGLCLTVAIADVSHYVRERTALDVEAARRGTSIYMPGRVIPMLPPRLSDDLCSLVPNRPRLCMVARMTFRRGVAIPDEVELFPGLMRSRARLTYTRVAEAMSEHLAALPEAPGFDLGAATRLFRTLRKGRLDRGALDLELPEPQVTLDDAGEPVGMRAAPRLEAHMLIEEFMIAANEAVARWFEEHELPCVYRIHEAPDPEKLKRFRSLSQMFARGLHLDEEPTPAQLSAFVEKLRSSPGAQMLQTVLLRSLMQARYSVANDGHFGLASDAYLHFTSPIRRYPDLLVHRELRAALERRKHRRRVDADGRSERRVGELGKLAESASENERKATELERKVDALYAARFCQAHVGDVFDGVVQACVELGLFVHITELGTEGLVPIHSLGPEYFELDEHGARLVGNRSGAAFVLGQPLKVKIIEASIERRQVTLALADEKRTTESEPTPRAHGAAVPPEGSPDERRAVAEKALNRWRQTRGSSGGGSKKAERTGRRGTKRR